MTDYGNKVQWIRLRFLDGRVAQYSGPVQFREGAPTQIVGIEWYETDLPEGCSFGPVDTASKEVPDVR